MKKLKVMILANDTTYTYNLRNEIIECLISDGYEVVVASQPLLFQEELKGLGCRLVNIETNRHGTNPLSDLGLLLKFMKVLSVMGYMPLGCWLRKASARSSLPKGTGWRGPISLP